MKNFFTNFVKQSSTVKSAHERFVDTVIGSSAAAIFGGVQYYIYQQDKKHAEFIQQQREKSAEQQSGRSPF